MTQARTNAQAGFSLLEVMIAFVLIVVIVFATVTTQSGSAASASRNRNIVIATNLARNLINQEEIKYEGLSFERLPEKEIQTFEDPAAKDFKAVVEYKKVDFSALTELIAKQSAKESEKSGGEEDPQSGTVLRIFKDYLEKSVRRMTVTIEWPEGTGTSSQTFTQLLVNYDSELKLSI